MEESHKTHRPHIKVGKYEEKKKTNRKTNTTVSAIRYDIHIHEIIILNDKSEYEKYGTHDDTEYCVSMKAAVVTAILYNNKCGTLFAYCI